MATLGQTQFYVAYTNGIPSYFAMPYQGNDPYGATPISKDQYVSGLQDMITKYPNETASGNVFNTADNKAKLQQVQSGTGIFAPGLIDPNTTRTADSANAANEAAVAAGTMQKVPIGSGFGYIPVNSPAAAQIANPALGNTATPNATAGTAPGNTQTGGLNFDQGQAANTANPPQFDAQGNLVPGTGGLPSSIGVTGSPSQGTSGGAMTTGAGTGTGAFTPTGDPKYDTLLTQLQGYLDKLTANGQKINPNVQITPEQIAQFTAQAATQIHPYYATQLQAATSSFLGGLGYDVNKYNADVQKAQTDYTRQLDTLSSQSADQGFAQSGIRQKQEGQLAGDTNFSLDSSRNALMQNAQNTAGQFAQTYGGLNTPTSNFNVSQARALPGQSTFSTQNSGLYTLDPNIYNKLIGSQQNAEKSATDTLSSQLQSNYLQGQANNATRSLNTV